MGRPENPQAFPNSEGKNQAATRGMTLRDYFAAKIAASLLSSVYSSPEAQASFAKGWAAKYKDTTLTTKECIVKESYEFADEMLKTR